jgi:hypothetical protein
VLKYIIHIKDNVDVRQCSRWSTNILQEETTSIFRAEQCLFYLEDGGKQVHQNVDNHLSHHTASHIGRLFFMLTSMRILNCQNFAYMIQYRSVQLYSE